MSNDMKCPVCNVGYVHESVNHWCCDYEFCPSYDETDTETYDILIRTRKALDVAVDALKRIKFRGEHSKYECCKVSGIIAQGALEQITAPEQKDKW